MSTCPNVPAAVRDRFAHQTEFHGSMAARKPSTGEMYHDAFLRAWRNQPRLHRRWVASPGGNQRCRCVPGRRLGPRMIAAASSDHAAGFLVIALVLLAYASLSRRLSTTVVSGPMIFVALGVLLGSKGFDLVDFSLRDETVRTVVEVTLVLVLFSDASRINLGGLRRHLALPGRL